MTTQHAHKGMEYILLLALAGLWGSSYLFLKIAVETIPPITLIASRVTIAAISWCGRVRLFRATGKHSAGF